MKRWVGIVGLVFIALAGLGLGYVLRSSTAAVQYVVVRGDTLGEIASAHGVTVDDLRGWNGIRGDLIEVGDVLFIHAAGTPDAPEAAPTRRTPRSGGSAAPKVDDGPPPLRMPAAKPCHAAPTGEGLADEGAVASAGLSYEQVKASMDAFAPTTLRCVPEGTAGRLETKIVAGCDGRVKSVEIGATGGLPADVVDCVTDTLRYAEFPAHGLPDGEVFEYPLSFSWE